MKQAMVPVLLPLLAAIAVTVIVAAVMGAPTATVAAPLVFLLACVAGRIRTGLTSLLAVAPMPALAIATLALTDQRAWFQRVPKAEVLILDRSGAVLLVVVALLWIAAGATAVRYLQDNPANRGRFVVCWLLTLTGNIAVLLASDLISFYLAFALASLPAWGLIAHDESADARRAGAINIAVAVLGEAFLLLGFVFLAIATPGGSLEISDAVAALPQSPWLGLTLALLIIGFGLKIGTVPLHFWMPLTYRAAPSPAAAVLSGGGVKAGVIGLIRFLPLASAQVDWGTLLVVFGLLSTFYGVAIGITQKNPKTILAYSSISQMGLIATVMGAGLSRGDAGAELATAFYAAHHVLVKGGLFLVIGVAGVVGGRRLWPVLLPAAVLALSLAGLPFSGGALAKLAIKAPLGDGTVGLLASLSGATSTLLMLHFLRQLAAIPALRPATRAPGSLTQTWLAVAIAAVAVPWAIYSGITDESLREAWSLKNLWGLLWPMLIGALLALLHRRWSRILPQIPEGDLVVPAERAAKAVLSWGRAFECGDALLRQWPVAGLALLTLAIVLGGALLAG